MTEPRSRPSSPPAAGTDLAPESGDPARPSFETIYRSSFSFVRALLSRRGIQPSDLDDAAHEVFLIVHRRHATYDPSLPLKPWLAAIAWGVAGNQRSRYRNARVLLAQDESGVPDLADPRLDVEQQNVQADTVQRVQRLLQEVESDQRAVLILHDLAGLGMPEIAEALEIPAGTGYSRLVRARAEFKAAVLRLNARERHEFGTRLAWTPFLLTTATFELTGGDEGGIVHDDPLAASWARLQREIGAAKDSVDMASGVAANAFSPGGQVGRTVRGKLATKAAKDAAVAWAKRAVSSAVSFTGSAGVGAGLVFWLLSRPIAPPVERLHDEIAAVSAVSPVTASVAEVPTASATAGPVREAPVSKAAAAPAGADGVLYRRAAAALHAGQLPEALELLRRHARKYPRSPLAQPRDALIISALAKSGRHAEAAALAERFRTAFPGSVSLDSVEAAPRGP